MNQSEAKSPRIKFCGLRRPEDIDLANQFQPDFIGLIFAKSKRQVTPEQAASLVSSLDPAIRPVGVFVNETVDQIVEIARQVPLRAVQLHGEEGPVEWAMLREQLDPEIEIWQKLAIPVDEQAACRRVREFECTLSALPPEAARPDIILLDTEINGRSGGTGQTFPWKLLADFASRHPVACAGGLNPGNVAQAISALHPAIVDCSSGIERNLEKQADLMTAFDQAVRTSKSEGSIMTHQTAPQPGDKPGRFGPYGGRYAAETLMPALLELDKAYTTALSDPAFLEEFQRLLRDYAGRPSLFYHAERLSKELGTKVFLKREDLNHTGAHKINNVLGQVLLARRMGKKRLIAETGAGQHGVATATAAALFGLECAVFMGAEDMERQALNVYRMELLGAEVHKVTSGTSTLKDATSEAMREWTRRADDTYYVIGSVMGPHPYPTIVRDFQRVIGDEIREQSLETLGRLPSALIACVGGGSNAMGTFFPFIDDVDVRLIGAEAAGEGIDTPRHAATMAYGRPGVFHGMHSLFLQDDKGQISPVYSISAGLDYPGIGPEHAWLQLSGRAEYAAITDREAVDAFAWLARLEGIIPAIESSHAVALLRKMADEFGPDDVVVVTLSGRGDKDVAAIQAYQLDHGLLRTDNREE